MDLKLITVVNNQMDINTAITEDSNILILEVQNELRKYISDH
jgi:hypothetical protein